MTTLTMPAPPPRLHWRFSKDNYRWQLLDDLDKVKGEVTVEVANSRSRDVAKLVLRTFGTVPPPLRPYLISEEARYERRTA